MYYNISEKFKSSKRVHGRGFNKVTFYWKKLNNIEAQNFMIIKTCKLRQSTKIFEFLCVCQLIKKLICSYCEKPILQHYYGIYINILPLVILHGEKHEILIGKRTPHRMMYVRFQ